MLRLILFTGVILLFSACYPNDEANTPNVDHNYILSEENLPAYEFNIDHQRFIQMLGEEFYHKGLITYREHCFNCHGNPEQMGTLPTASKFWADSLSYGRDPYSMYQTITRGRGLMAPQVLLSPREKYEVIHFIREEFIKPLNPEAYFEIDTAYIANLPLGDTLGPEPSEYSPWAEVDYGNFLIHTYEVAGDSMPPRVISGGRSPLANEDYRKVNFAYKGLAMRLDPGDGGIAKGTVFALFDLDLMRIAGFWEGSGFIDYRSILLNDEHNIYPRTVGHTLFESPVEPGWANPETNEFVDPRFEAVDGRKFGPLPSEWVRYNGLYPQAESVIVDYNIGHSSILESFSVGYSTDSSVFLIRNLTIQLSNHPLKLRMAPESAHVSIQAPELKKYREDGFWVVDIPAGEKKIHFNFAISDRPLPESLVLPKALDLYGYTSGFNSPDAGNLISSPIISGGQDKPYTVDVFSLPLENPWNSRMRPTGLDFLEDGESAVLSTIDGEVFKIDGILNATGNIQWRRIASGLFQPLGIVYHQGEIYVGCRDQIVRLVDLNGDGVTDYYDCFNGDHQVTEHFHEFAMGLQVDDLGNFYYAKSGRHARRSLVPQHGTLIKVSPDGSTSEILANGFRAANGVCLNPDGSFYVTDQEGYWNPMNRINKVIQGGFYGNMYGYNPPADSSDSAMEPPMMWVDMKYDRSPAELMWMESDRWGPLNGALLSFSYGYGKVFVVYPQTVDGVEQGAMFELPVPQFPTGLMRGRVNPTDGQLYVCGMSAWATSQMIQTGGLYRIRYNNLPAHVPIQFEVAEGMVKITFSDPLDANFSKQSTNYEINTWDLKRSRRYGSDRLNPQSLEITEVEISADGKSLKLHVPEIAETWVMELLYQLQTKNGDELEGAITSTIYNLE